MTREKRMLRALMILLVLFTAALMEIKRAEEMDLMKAQAQRNEDILELLLKSRDAQAGQLQELRTLMEELNRDAAEYGPVSRGGTHRYTQEDLKLLARIVHAEAEGETDWGKALVAKVILNRHRVGGWYGSTLQEVIYKPRQFSGTKRDCFRAGVYTEADMAAVQRAMALRGYDALLYFWNPAEATDKAFVASKAGAAALTVGRHVFSP